MPMRMGMAMAIQISTSSLAKHQKGTQTTASIVMMKSLLLTMARKNFVMVWIMTATEMLMEMLSTFSKCTLMETGMVLEQMSLCTTDVSSALKPPLSGLIATIMKSRYTLMVLSSVMGLIIIVMAKLMNHSWQFF